MSKNHGLHGSNWKIGKLLFAEFMWDMLQNNFTKIPNIDKLSCCLLFFVQRQMDISENEKQTAAIAKIFTKERSGRLRTIKPRNKLWGYV